MTRRYIRTILKRSIIRVRAEETIEDIKQIFTIYNVGVLNNNREFSPVYVVLRTDEDLVSQDEPQGVLLKAELVDGEYYFDIGFYDTGLELMEQYPYFDYALNLTTSKTPEIIGHGVNPGTFLFSVPKMDWVESVAIILDARNRELN